MEITKIEKQKRGGNRFNVFIDGKFAFGLGKESLIDSGIKTKDLLNQAQINKLIFNDQKNRAYKKALNFLDYRSRSEKEIRDKLKERKFKEKIIEETIKKLSNLSLINDLEFTKLWINDRDKLKPTGKRVLYFELMKKGISKNIIEEVLNEINENDEFKKALNLIESKRKFKKLSYEEAYKKVGGLLFRRGFSYSVVKKIIDKLYKKKY